MWYYLNNMKPLAIFFLLTLPSVVFGQTPPGLVTCAGPDCDMCDFVNMINGIVNWLFGFLVLAAVFGLMISGFKLVVSAGNEAAWSAAKSMVTSVVVGLVIVLSAWLIVDTIMKGFVKDSSGIKSEFGMWNQIADCGGISKQENDSEEKLYCYTTVGAGITNVHGKTACEAARAQAITSGQQVGACYICGN
jgi:hypothetical protein